MAKRPKQKWIPGTEPLHDTELSKAAEAYSDAKDDAELAARKEEKAKAKLIELMKSKKLESYIDRGLGLRVVYEHTETDKVKLKKVGDDERENNAS